MTHDVIVLLAVLGVIGQLAVQLLKAQAPSYVEADSRCMPKAGPPGYAFCSE